MRILLFAALTGAAYAATCLNTAGGNEKAVCAEGAFFSDAATGTSCTVGTADNQDCVTAAGPCCTACDATNGGAEAGVADCESDDTNQTTSTKCGQGFGLGTSSWGTLGKCSTCTAGTDWNNAVDGAICATIAAACTSGGKWESVAPTKTANRECSNCATGVYTCSSANATSATKCKAGYSFETGVACNECASGKFITGDDHATVACATRTVRDCTGAFAAGPPATGGYAKEGDGVTDNLCTACPTGATECSGAAGGTHTKCAAGYGLVSGTCTICDNGFFALANGTAVCAAHKNATACGDGKWTKADGTKEQDHTCGNCFANTKTCTTAAADGASTCNDGYWKDTSTCKECTALAAAPANASAHTVSCTTAADSKVKTVTCKATFKKDTAGTACVADGGTTTPTVEKGTCADKAGKDVPAQKDKGKAACEALTDHKWTAAAVEKGVCKDKAGKEVAAQKDKGKAACEALTDHKWTAAKKDEESPAFIAGAAIGLIALLL